MSGDNAGCKKLFDTGLRDNNGKRFAGTGMRAEAKGEDSPVASEEVKSRRAGIACGITVRRSQNHENCCAGAHFLTCDDPILSKETTGILDGRIITQHFEQQLSHEARICSDLLTRLGMRIQRQ
jgi:hypothetical protein